MMRAVFAHDHIFTRYRNRYYSPNRLPYSAWQCYLEHFGELTVLARVRDADTEAGIAGMQVADGLGVSFVGLRAVRGIRRIFGLSRSDRRVAIKTIAGAHAVIARIPSEIGLFAAREARRNGVLVAFEVVASAWHSLWHHGGWLSKLYAPVLEWRTRRTVWRSDFALYVTNTYLQGQYPSSGTVACASDVTIDPSPGVLQRRLARIQRQEATATVGFVGTLNAAYKSLDTVLDAVKLVIDRGHRIELRIIGDGPADPWRERTQRLEIADVVRFMGTLPGSTAVQEWLDSIDIYVHPSRAEGLPRSLVEAMSRGCLCFGSTVGGIPELLDSPYLHRPGDAPEVGRMIAAGTTDRRMRSEAARTNIDRTGAFQPWELKRKRSAFFATVARRARGRLSPNADVGVNR